MRRICLAANRRLRSGAPGGKPSATDATAPRLRIVPDVPMTPRSRRAPPGADTFRSPLDVPHQLPLVARVERSLLTKRSVRRMTPSLKLFPSSIAGPVPRSPRRCAPSFDATRRRPHADAIDGGEVYQPGFLRSGNDARRISGLLCIDWRNSPPFSLSRVALVATAITSSNLMRIRQTPEFRQHLERGVHRLSGERASIEAHRPPAHLSFSRSMTSRTDRAAPARRSCGWSSCRCRWLRYA